MLKKLSVRNLGCFDSKEHSIDFTQETLLAGPNNSGKSMFLSGINIIRHQAFGMFRWTTDMYNLVSFPDCVNNHNQNATIFLDLDIKEQTQETSVHFEVNRRNKPSFRIESTPAFASESQSEAIRKLVKKIWYLRPHRSHIEYSSMVQPTSGPLQPLNADGSNVTNFMLERWTDRDEKWDIAESWLTKIDPEMGKIKTPIRGNVTSLETMYGTVPINMSLQGSGFQSATSIIAALVFSPEGSTIIIEEPEVFLHPSSQEVIVDLINDAVKNQNKQVIFSTHSFNILCPFYNDCGREANRVRRGEKHERADPQKFSLYTFEKTLGQVSMRRISHNLRWISNKFGVKYAVVGVQQDEPRRDSD
jgi:predicted ATPase